MADISSNHCVCQQLCFRLTLISRQALIIQIKAVSVWSLRSALESILNGSFSVSLECVVDSGKCEKWDNDKRVWGETQCEDLGVTRREVREESVNGPVQLQCVRRGTRRIETCIVIVFFTVSRSDIFYIWTLWFHKFKIFPTDIITPAPTFNYSSSGMTSYTC